MDGAKHLAAVERAAAPLIAAQEAATRSMAPLLKMQKEADRFHRQIMTSAGWEYVEDEDPIPPAEKPLSMPPPAAAPSPAPVAATAAPARDADVPPAGQPQPQQRWEPPATTYETIPEGLALYERRDAPAWFVERLRLWWPPFDPRSYPHWIRLERELKEIHGGSSTDPRSPGEFDRQRLQWTWEELVAHMESVRLIVGAPRGKRGKPSKTTAEGWTCSQWLAAEFTRHPEYRGLSDEELAKLPGCRWAKSTVRTCTTRKAQRQLEKRELEERRRREADDLRDGLETGAVRFTNRKTAVGQQKRRNPADQSAERAERDHDAAAEEFIAKAERKRSRPK